MMPRTSMANTTITLTPPPGFFFGPRMYNLYIHTVTIIISTQAYFILNIYIILISIILSCYNPDLYFFFSNIEQNIQFMYKINYI